MATKKPTRFLTRIFFNKYYLFAKFSPARFRGRWPTWTGQPAIWPLENPHWGGGRNVCCPFLTRKWGWEARNVMSKLAGRESGCEGSRWQIWRHASPAAANTPNYCTPQILPLVAPLGPLPSAASVTLTCAPYTTIRTSANGSVGGTKTEPNGRLAFMTVDMHCMLIMCWVDRHASARLPARVPWKWSLPESHHI